MSPSSAHATGTIEYAAELIRHSKRTVVMTGAGISTPSGIPDFRSEGTGLWSQMDPMEVASLSAFRYAPERFFKSVRPFVSQIVDAQPNPAHQSLARLEKAGFVRMIITQNIDGLHQKAGSKNVLEVHGTLGTVSCTHCFRQFPSESYVLPFIREGIIPHCPDCGGILKPDIILYGEQLPVQTFLAARTEVRACDLMLVAGSSLEVLPAAGLPLQALDQGAHLVIVNASPTYLGERADVLILGDVAEIIPLIAKRVLDD